MDDDLHLSGGLGNIPDNIVGSTSHDLKIGGNIRGDSLSEELSAKLAVQPTSNLHFIPNDETLAGIQSKADIEDQKEKRKNDVVKLAKLKAMVGKDANEIYQCLKQAFTDADISGLPHLQELLDKPFLWFLFVDDPSAFESCNTAKSNLRRLGRNSLYVLSGPQCSGCRSNDHNGCRVLGKRLIKSLDFTPKMFGEISETLRMLGVIKADRSVKSINEMKIALSSKKDNSVRIYNAPKLEITPKISLDDAMA
jgi:hypothetical protein